MIEYQSLKKVTDEHLAEYEQAVKDVIESGWYLQGVATKRFEEHYAQYIGTRYCVSCGNGLDALTLIFRALKELGRIHEGDEVIVPANTYIASIISITENRLVPVLVEPSLDTLQIDDKLIESRISDRTRAILIVHLYGRCAYTQHIGDLCKAHNLLLIEDNAQAHGCRFLPADSTDAGLGDDASKSDRPRTGNLGIAAGHSFYPSKNLGAFGDAGAVTTNDPQIASLIRALGNYGSHRKYVFNYVGKNSRMDEIQAAILDVKLKYLDKDNNRRRQIAKRYLSEIINPILKWPLCPNRDTVWHIFPILCKRRDELQSYLAEKGVQAIIHYPIPPHKQQCYSSWSHMELPITEQIHREELSIPIYPCLTEQEVSYIIRCLNEFSPAQ